MVRAEGRGSGCTTKQLATYECVQDSHRTWPDLTQLSRERLLTFVRRLLYTLHSSGISEEHLLQHAINAFQYTLAQPQRALSIPSAPRNASTTPSGFRAPASQSTGSEQHQAKYSLRLSHICHSQGCADAKCKLCRFNPHKKCTENFRKPPHAYTTDDPIVARCQGPLVISIHDRDGNQLPQCPPHLEGCVIMAVALQSRRLSRQSEDLSAGEAPPLEHVADYILHKPKTGRLAASVRHSCIIFLFCDSSVRFRSISMASAFPRIFRVTCRIRQRAAMCCAVIRHEARMTLEQQKCSHVKPGFIAFPAERALYASSPLFSASLRGKLTSTSATPCALMAPALKSVDIASRNLSLSMR
jgi:hypothetical protein